MSKRATNGFMRCNIVDAVSEIRLSGVQLVKQGLGLLQIELIEATMNQPLEYLPSHGDLKTKGGNGGSLRRFYLAAEAQKVQRLDDQFLMRQSEAPQLKRLPSDYMRENCWYTTQPMETTHPRALQVTLDMINAETQLLFSSDWPHFDFDLPSVIYDLPFLSEQTKRNILGLNAAQIFHLDPSPRKKL